MMETSPQAPLRTKRRNPFGESSAVPRKTHVPQPKDWDEIYQRTMNSLMNAGEGSFALAPQSEGLLSTLDCETKFGFCNICSLEKQTTECAHCSHAACELCVRQCDTCHDVFCSFCSTINYDQRYDRMLCLTCNGEERRRNVSRMAENLGMAGPSSAFSSAEPMQIDSF